PYLEPRLRPLLDREDLDPIESRRVFARRLAPVRTLSEGAGRENRRRRRDSVPADTRVHRSAHDRRGNSDPQGGDRSLLSRASGAGSALPRGARAGRTKAGRAPGAGALVGGEPPVHHPTHAGGGGGGPPPPPARPGARPARGGGGGNAPPPHPKKTTPPGPPP